MDNEMKAWLEDTLRYILENNSDKIAFVGQSGNGEIFTAYFGVDCAKKVEFASHIQVDAMMDVIKEEDDE